MAAKLTLNLGASGAILRAKRTRPAKQPATCPACTRFFARFRCNKPEECDCPKCQGYCACRKG